MTDIIQKALAAVADGHLHDLGIGAHSPNALGSCLIGFY